MIALYSGTSEYGRALAKKTASANPKSPISGQRFLHQDLKSPISGQTYGHFEALKSPIFQTNI